MMPSRGLHLARGRLPRTYQRPCRNLSSTARPNLRTASAARTSLNHTSPPWTRSIPIAIPPITAVRHASTAPASTAPAAQQTAEGAAAATATATWPPESTASFPNLDTINLDAIDKAGYMDATAIPETIGYLHRIGIDFGFGPTSLIQWVLEHFHVWGGMPWWGAILATGALSRICLFPLYLKMSDSVARQQALASVTKPFYERVKAARETGDTADIILAWRQIGAIHKRAGISTGSQLRPLVLQGVLGFCGFRLMRAMVALPVPGFRDGGFLWMQNLTLTDGYLLLPLFMAGFIHMIGRMGGEAGASAAIPPMMRKGMIYGMPVLVFAFTSFQPGAIALWFCGTGAVGLVQGRLLQTEAVRKFFNLAPIYKPTPGESSEGGLLGAMMGKGRQEAQEQAAASRSASSSAAAGGKNAAYMSPRYQAPNISTQGRTIDTKLVGKSAPASDMVQAEKKGVFDTIKDMRDNVSEKIEELQKRVAAAREGTAESRAKAQKADFKARAAAYEERAQKASKQG